MDHAQVMTSVEEDIAIKASGLGKSYKLFGSQLRMAVDLLGLGPLLFWRRDQVRTFEALKDVNLTIRRGERVGIIGRNGAGKTTLLKLLTQVVAPNVGSLQVNGHIQALMQTGIGFHPEFTGYENIRSSLIYNGLSAVELEAAIVDVVEFSELGEYLHQPLRTYSLGMRSRLQFATATAIKPDIVIVDEVLGAGDAYFSAKSAERVKRLTATGCTLLLVSHSMSQVLQFTDRALWIDKGSVIMDGDALRVVNAYEEFMNSLSDGADEGSSGNPASGGTLKEVPRWFLEKGQEVNGLGEGGGANWGGAGPVRISGITLVNAAGDECKSIPMFEKFGLKAKIISEEEGIFPCSCLFVIYDEAGNTVARFVEPQRDYAFHGNDEVNVTATIEGNPIGRGQYLISAGLYANYNFGSPGRSHRYHILSRALSFRIISDQADDSRVHLTVDWKSENA